MVTSNSADLKRYPAIEGRKYTSGKKFTLPPTKPKWLAPTSSLANLPAGGEVYPYLPRGESSVETNKILNLLMAPEPRTLERQQGDHNSQSHASALRTDDDGASYRLPLEVGRQLAVNTAMARKLKTDLASPCADLIKSRELQRNQNLLATDPPSLDFTAYSQLIQARISAGSASKLLGRKRPRPGGDSGPVTILINKQKPSKQAKFSSNPSLIFDAYTRASDFSSPEQRLPQPSPAPAFSAAPSAMESSAHLAENQNSLKRRSADPSIQVAPEIQNHYKSNPPSRTWKATHANQNFEDPGSCSVRIEDAHFRCALYPVPMPQSAVFEPEMRKYLAKHFPKVCGDWPVQIILGQHFVVPRSAPSEVPPPSSKRFLVFHFTKPQGKIDFRLFECLHQRNPAERCYKKFSNLSKFYDHIRTHTKEKPFRCQFCTEGFGQKGNLIAHVSQRHLRDKRYPCSICGQEFSRKNNMRQHELSHLEERQLPISISHP